MLWSWCWYTLDLAVPGSIPTIAIYFCVSCRNGENDNFKKSKVQSSSPNNDNATSSWLSTTENAEKQMRTMQILKYTPNAHFEDLPDQNVDGFF